MLTIEIERNLGSDTVIPYCIIIFNELIWIGEKKQNLESSRWTRIL